MDDNKLNELFSNFKPGLTSDKVFMERLQQRLDAVAIVREETAAIRRRSRIAVIVAAVAGFIMGVGCTLLMQLIGDSVSTMVLSLPFIGLLDIDINWQMTGWIAMAVVSCITAVNAYEITFSRLSAAKSAAA